MQDRPRDLRLTSRMCWPLDHHVSIVTDPIFDNLNVGRGGSARDWLGICIGPLFAMVR